MVQNPYRYNTSSSWRQEVPAQQEQDILQATTLTPGSDEHLHHGQFRHQKVLLFIVFLVMFRK